jgi:hypothetical protein
MISRPWLVAVFFLTAVIALASCKPGNPKSQSADSANPSAATQPSGIEKIKPAPGTGNLQGKILYNGKPAANIEVKLCETFNRYFGGCGGKSYTARTDQGGEYVIANVPPMSYEGLLARVFDTNEFIFATSGIAGLSTPTYEVAADKTLFVTSTNLFKSDLKLVNPKAGAKVSAQGLELKWEPYPDAAYYKFSIHPEDVKITSPYIGERVEATLFPVDKPLEKGVYRWEVTAYNGADQKLAESNQGIKFTIN